MRAASFVFCSGVRTFTISEPVNSHLIFGIGLFVFLSLRAAKEGLPVYFPSRKLSTDNAAMIAAAAYPKLLARNFADAEFSAEASLPLR
jgi:hypothetical protein